MSCCCCRTLRLLALGVSDELRRLLSHVGFKLPPVYLRLVAPMNDTKALALLMLQVRDQPMNEHLFCKFLVAR